MTVARGAAARAAVALPSVDPESTTITRAPGRCRSTERSSLSTAAAELCVTVTSAIPAPWWVAGVRAALGGRAARPRRSALGHRADRQLREALADVVGLEPASAGAPAGSQPVDQLGIGQHLHQRLSRGRGRRPGR